MGDENSGLKTPGPPDWGLEKRAGHSIGPPHNDITLPQSTGLCLRRTCFRIFDGFGKKHGNAT